MGRIIVGGNHAVANVSLSTLLSKIQRILKAIDDQQNSASSPPLALNKHCAEREFQTRCRQAAVQKGDLSLLTTLAAKEQKKNKGIFTVLQLSQSHPRNRQSIGGSGSIGDGCRGGVEFLSFETTVNSSQVADVTVTQSG